MNAEEQAAIAALREQVHTRQAAEPPKPTVAMVRQIVDDLVAAIPLTQTADTLAGEHNLDLEELGDREQFILDVTATLGTWLAHSVGRADVAVLFAADEDQPSLFPELTSTPNTLVVPIGYEPTAAHRRDLTKALAAVLHHRPNDDVLSRFVARTYGMRQSVMAYPVVAGTWGFARRGRLGTLHQVSDDLVFLSQSVAAYDLLDVARSDAVAAISELADADSSDLHRIEQLADTCRWLAESELRTLARAAATAAADQRARPLVDRELGYLRQRLAAHPGRYLPASVGELTLGQVQRICVTAGLKVEADSRREEHEIRVKLKELGLNADADRLVPEALRAANRGELAAFWDIMRARVEGDTTWAEQLSNLLSSDTAAVPVNA